MEALIGNNEQRFLHASKEERIKNARVDFKEDVEFMRSREDDMHEAACHPPAEHLAEPSVGSCPSTIRTVPIAARRVNNPPVMTTPTLVGMGAIGSVSASKDFSKYRPAFKWDRCIVDAAGDDSIHSPRPDRFLPITPTEK